MKQSLKDICKERTKKIKEAKFLYRLAYFVNNTGYIKFYLTKNELLNEKNEVKKNGGKILAESKVIK